MLFIVSPFTIQKLIPLMLRLQNLSISVEFKIWLSIGLCRVAFVASLLTAPPMPSKGDLPGPMAKKFQTKSTLKPIL